VNIATEIGQLEQQLRQAMQSSNVGLLESLLSDELIFTNQDGLRLTKEDDLSAHRSGLLSIEKLDIVDQHIRALDDIAIVWVTATLAGSYSGRAFGGTFAYTRLWRRRDGRWRIEMGHCCNVAPTT